MQNDNHFHYIVPVWGDKYTEQFINVCLPMLIWQTGLLSMGINPNDKFVISTTWDDKNKIIASTHYKKLCEIIPVEFNLIDGLVDLNDNYCAMSYCYASVMNHKCVVPGKTHFVFLTADSFWAEGTFKHMQEVRDKGFKVMMAMGISAKLEAISNIVPSVIDNRRPMAKSRLIEMLINNMHPRHSSFNMLARNSFPNDWPSNLHWVDKDKKQLIAHCFHMHPLMVKAPNKKVRIDDTIDSKYIKNLNYKTTDFYVCQRDYFGVELTSENIRVETSRQNPSLEKIVKFSLSHIGPVHYHFFKQQVIIGTDTQIDRDLLKLITSTVDRISEMRGSPTKVSAYQFYYFQKKAVKNALWKSKNFIVKTILNFTAIPKTIKQLRYSTFIVKRILNFKAIPEKIKQLRYSTLIVKTILNFKAMPGKIKQLRYSISNDLKRFTRHAVRVTYNGLKQFISYLFLIEPSMDKLRSTLQNQGLTGAVAFLKGKYFIYKPASVKFLIHLYKYLANEAPIAQLDENNKYFIIHFCCWGKSYADKAKNFLLPSLLAKGNLPSLAKHFKVILFIHCDRETHNSLSSSIALDHIRQYADIQLHELPKRTLKYYKKSMNYPEISIFKNINRRNFVLKYLLLGALQTAALLESIRLKALISFMMPDTVLSDEFYTIAIDKIKNKKLVGATTFRTNYYSAYDGLSEFYSQPARSILSITASDMTKLQIEHLHHHDQRRTISEKTNSFLAAPRLIFKAKNGLIIRAVQYHPILLDSSKVDPSIKSDYWPIDDSLLTYVLTDDAPYSDQVWLCEDATLLNIMELSGEEPDKLEVALPNEVNYLSYEQLVEAVFSMIHNSQQVFNNRMNQFFILNKVSFCLPTSYHHETEIIDDEVFLNDVYGKLKSIGHDVSPSL